MLIKTVYFRQNQSTYKHIGVQIRQKCNSVIKTENNEGHIPVYGKTNSSRPASLNDTPQKEQYLFVCLSVGGLKVVTELPLVTLYTSEWPNIFFLYNTVCLYVFSY